MTDRRAFIITGHRGFLITGHRGFLITDHLRFIITENHSCNTYVGRFPGTNGATVVRTASGAVVPLADAPAQVSPDISHSAAAAELAYDGGRMDRFDRIAGAMALGVVHSYVQMRPRDIPAYWAYARHFVLDDHFFSTIMGPRFVIPRGRIPDANGSSHGLSPAITLTVATAEGTDAIKRFTVEAHPRVAALYGSPVPGNTRRGPDWRPWTGAP